MCILSSEEGEAVKAKTDTEKAEDTNDAAGDAAWGAEASYQLETRVGWGAG